MTDAFDHNKLIASTAKAVLLPLGMKRDGKSRLWFDDHGWWSIIVEFQPSAWSRGSYLNIGVCWFLYEQSSWRFHVGYREQEQGFARVRSEAQFADEIAGMADHARITVTEYREKFATIDGVFQYYEKTPLRGHWDYYHAAVVAALRGDLASSRKHFKDLQFLPIDYQWQKGLHYRAADLMSLLDDRPSLLKSLIGIVFRTRSEICLPEISEDQLGLGNLLAV